MNCRKAENLLSRYIDGELPYMLNSEVMEHVNNCKSCSDKLAEMQRGVDALHALPMDDPGDDFNAIVEGAKREADAKRYAFAIPICRWGIALSIVLILIVLAIPTYVSELATFMGKQEIYVIGSDHLIPGNRASLRVVVAKRGARNPINGADVTLTLNGPNMHSLQLMSGKTNRAGTINGSFRVPTNISGNYQITAIASSSEGRDVLKVPVEVKRSIKVMITTDKPIYQPGQTIHIRTLALQRPSLIPVKDRKIKFIVEDSKQNRVFNKTFNLSKWGIASADFELGDQINTGQYSITATMVGSQVKKTVMVKNYALPKFKVTLATNHSYYIAGQIIRGTLSARYFFGKPASDVDVRISLSAPNARFAEINGRTNSDGVFKFESKVPNQLVSNGNASINISAAVIDGSQHTEEIVQSLPVAKDPLQIAVVPESGQLVPGVENIVYVVTSFPDGTPAQTNTSIVIDGKAQICRSDELGVSLFRMVPGKEKVSIGVNAAIPGGVSSSTVFTYGADEDKVSEFDDYYRWAIDRGSISDIKALGGVLVRADKAVYKSGDNANITVLSTKKTGPVYIDAILDGQTLFTKTAFLKGGNARASFSISNDYSGTLTFSAYILSAIGTPIRDTATVLVQNTNDLKISIKQGKNVYRPGEHARLEFNVSDNRGKGVPTAIGVNIVDESVYSVQEQMPGLAALYFAVQKDILKPKDEKPLTDEDMHNSYRTYRRDPEQLARVVEQRLLNQNSDITGTLPDWNNPENILSQKQNNSIQQAAKVLFASAMNVSNPSESSITQKAKEIAVNEAKHSFIGDGGFGWFMVISYLTMLSLMIWNAYRHHRPYILIATIIPLINLAILMITSLIGLQIGYEHTGLNETLGTTSAILLIPFTIVAFIAVSRISAAWMQFGICLGIFLILAAILFPVFARARECARSSVGSDLRMMASAIAKRINPISSRVTGSISTQHIRQFFPETLYSNPSAITDESGRGYIDFDVADSITTWRISAVASSMNGQIGSTIAPMKVFQDVFVDLDLPSGVTQGDSISVPVAVYNYLPTPQIVTLKLIVNRWFQNNGANEKTIKLKPSEVSVAYFPITATLLGKQSLIVEAEFGSATDAIKKELIVYPNGQRQNGVVNGVASDGGVVKLNIPHSSISGATKMFVRIYPGVVSQMAGGLEGLLQEPYGCFEQTSSIAYPNVLVMKYLKATHKAKSAVLKDAERLVNLGYQRLISYEVPGGGFDWYGRIPADTILTAYGIMEFSDMADVTQVDRSMINRSRALLEKRQNSDGSWNTYTISETLDVACSKYCSTAYVTWALAEAGFASSDAVKRGCAYLRSNLSKISDSYTIALAANAFVASGYDSQATEKLLNLLSASALVNKDRASWSSKSTTLTYSYGNVAQTETTALAAYAFLKSQTHTTLAEKALNELIYSRGRCGSWDTTQATIIALKALLAGANESNNRAGDVDIVVNGRSVEKFHLNGIDKDILHVVDASKFARSGINTVRLNIRGKARPTYQVISEYYTPWAKSKKQKSNLHFDVSYAKQRIPRNGMVDVTARVGSDKETVKMGIVNLGIAPGFRVVTEDLELLKSKRGIDRYEVNPSQIILYVRDIKPNHPVSLRCRLRAQYPVQAQVPASRAYDYYNPNTCSSLSLPENIEIY